MQRSQPTQSNQAERQQQPRTDKGKFASPYSEKRGQAIAIRLPKSLDSAVRAAAGDDLKQWIEAALREKLAREG